MKNIKACLYIKEDQKDLKQLEEWLIEPNK